MQNRSLILNIPIDFISKEDALYDIDAYISSSKNHLVVTPYASFWYWAEHDTEFKNALEHADLALPDGIGVCAAGYMFSKTYSQSLPIRIFQVLWYGFITGIKTVSHTLESSTPFRRITGVDLVEDIFRIAEQKGYSVFLLGGWETSLKKLHVKLAKDYPQLRFDSDVGSTDVRSEKGKAELEKVLQKINVFHPDMLLVAFGPPFQEKWAHDHLQVLHAKATMCVGATFDLLSGELRRAPRFFRQMGLEWLWRFLTQPRRLLRIWAAFPWFPMRIAWEIVKNKHVIPPTRFDVRRVDESGK